MTNSERLDEIENRLDRTEALLEATARLTMENSQQLRQTMLIVDRLANAQMELARAFDEDRQRFEQTQASNNAALERIDRIMDYLMRRDGERGAES